MSESSNSKIEVIPRHVFSHGDSVKGGRQSGVVRRIRSAIQRGDVAFFQEFKAEHGERMMVEAFNVLQAGMGNVEGVCPKCHSRMAIQAAEVSKLALTCAQTILKYMADPPSHKVERIIHAEEFGRIALSAALEVYGKDKLEQFAAILLERLND